MSFLDTISGHKSQTDQEIIAEYQDVLKQVEPEEPSERTKKRELDENIRAMIEMVVDNEGTLNIQIKWNEMDGVTSDTIGTLLYNINEGSFSQAFANILIGVAQQQPKSQNFIKSCLAAWRKSKDTNPIIKPSEVFGMGNTSGPPQKG